MVQMNKCGMTNVTSINKASSTSPNNRQTIGPYAVLQ
jgi:hypothetical protein